MTAPVTERVWQGIVAPEPPCMRDDHCALLAMAEGMLRTRRERFPALVAASNLDAGVAERELATFEAIVADWQFIAKGVGRAAHSATRQARVDALDASLATIAGIAADRGGVFSQQLEHQAHCVIAMRWHLEPGRRTHALARITHEMRAEAAAPSQEAA